VTKLNKSVAQQSAPKPLKKKRKGVSLSSKKARAGWFFVAPFAIGMIVIYLPMIFNALQYSFNSLTPKTSGMQLNFVGLKYYREALFDDPNYYQTLIGGIRQLVFDIPTIVIFSLFMAVLLNQKMFGRAAFRAIFFLPVITATGIIAEMDNINTLLRLHESGEGIETGANTSDGIANIITEADVSRLFSGMRFGSIDLIGYITVAINNIYNIINRSGVQMLIFLAGLQSISPEVYESCNIDGATAWETFWKITFPMISPMILVNLVYTVIDSFTASNNSVMQVIASRFGQGEFSLSSAMAWIYFLVVVVVVAVFGLIASTYVFYQRRD